MPWINLNQQRKNAACIHSLKYVFLFLCASGLVMMEERREKRKGRLGKKEQKLNPELCVWGQAA